MNKERRRNIFRQKPLFEFVYSHNFCVIETDYGDCLLHMYVTDLNSSNTNFFSLPVNRAFNEKQPC